MIELWRGNANAWECDELGHMNVRFYLAKASEALANLAEHAGLGGVFRADTHATLRARDIHIKFLAEARPGAPLAIQGGFESHDADTARLVLLMSHAGTDQLAATFRIDLAQDRQGFRLAGSLPGRLPRSDHCGSRHCPTPRHQGTGTHGGRQSALSGPAGA
jgi:acyl-CoA thioesterase FadM